MMRWWNNEAFMKKYAESAAKEPEVTNELGTKKNDLESSNKYLDQKVYDNVTRPWTFKVRAEVTVGEVVCVTGNCDTLGDWKHDQVYILTKEKSEGEGEGEGEGYVFLSYFQKMSGLSTNLFYFYLFMSITYYTTNHYYDRFIIHPNT